MTTSTIFTTWTTYGSWLRGDVRGWFLPNDGPCGPIREFVENDTRNLAESPVRLSHVQCQVVELTIRRHVEIRAWVLHGLCCLSNHVHVLVEVPHLPIELPREQFKSWGTRNLRSTDPARSRWWTERGWDVFVDTDEDRYRVQDYIAQQSRSGE